MTIAMQLFRENRVLEILYRKASLYAEANIVKPAWGSKWTLRRDINFTFNDSSTLRIVRGSCGQFIHASLSI